LWRLSSAPALWRLALRARLVALGRLVHHLGELVAAHALQRVLARGVGRALAHRSAGQHRGQAALDQRVAFLGTSVGERAQELVLALLARLLLQPDQQPFPLLPLAFERKVEVPLVDVLPALAWHRLPGAAIPQHYRAAAVLALRDDPLEVGIGHRVVL